MRTFPGHERKSDLHGTTVVVETDGGEIWIGRCDDVVEAGIVLRDADVHRGGEAERPRADWLSRARRFGVWPRHRQVVVPAARVTGVRRLAEI